MRTSILLAALLAASAADAKPRPSKPPASSPRAAKDDDPDKAERERLDGESSAAEEKARRLSKASDYAGAAAALEAFAGANEKVRASLKQKVERVRTTAAGYRRRAGWAAKAATSGDDARFLLRDLLVPADFGLDRGDMPDERVVKLVRALKELDRDFALFFSKRQLAVSVKADGEVTPVRAQVLADRAITGLRALGFEAKEGDGEEKLVLQASVGSQGSLGALFGDKGGGIQMESCRAAIAARWTGPGQVVVGFDLAGVSTHINPDECRRGALAKAGEIVAREMLVAWLKAQP